MPPGARLLSLTMISPLACDSGRATDGTGELVSRKLLMRSLSPLLRMLFLLRRLLPSWVLGFNVGTAAKSSSLLKLVRLTLLCFLVRVFRFATVSAAAADLVVVGLLLLGESRKEAEADLGRAARAFGVMGFAGRGETRAVLSSIAGGARADLSCSSSVFFRRVKGQKAILRIGRRLAGVVGLEYVRVDAWAQI